MAWAAAWVVRVEAAWAAAARAAAEWAAVVTVRVEEGWAAEGRAAEERAEAGRRAAKAGQAVPRTAPIPARGRQHPKTT